MTIADQYGVKIGFQCRLKGYDPKKDTTPTALADKNQKKAIVKDLQQRVDAVKAKPARAKKPRAGKKA